MSRKDWDLYETPDTAYAAEDINAAVEKIVKISGQSRIDLERISSPTLILYGNQDHYMDLDLLGSALESLPEGSELHMVEGGSHILIYERPFYQEFQNRIVGFLRK